LFSPLLIDKSLHAYSKAGVRYTPKSISDSIDISSRLTKKFDKYLESIPAEKRSKTPWSACNWTGDELAFMRSEILLCRTSFRYWSERYGYAELDASEGVGVAPAKFWPSQERALTLISQRQEENELHFQKHGFSTGILIAWHKTRQQGATALARLINGHRMTLYKNVRAIAGTLDDEKAHELYTRDKVILDNLPFFMRPSLEFDVKDSHIGLEILKSRLVYQIANQRSGIGTGQQFDMSHMTEVALWEDAHRLEFDFLPAVPQSRNVFVGFESTANGKGGFWYEFTESIRKRESGFENWIYSFTPWYINHNKNRLAAPDLWSPNQITVEHAALIERTSAEFAGTTIHPTRNQLYWWETEYNLSKKLGTLFFFLSSYPATPEQSFQLSSHSAFPLETIEWMRAGADEKMGMPYSVEWK
jgi:hypothetical protein